MLPAKFPSNTKLIRKPEMLKLSRYITKVYVLFPSNMTLIRKPEVLKLSRYITKVYVL